MHLLRNRTGPRSGEVAIKRSRGKQPWQEKRPKSQDGPPSHETLGRLLSANQPDAFQKDFEARIQALARLEEDGQSNHKAINETVLRRCLDLQKEPEPLWQVCA